MNDVGSPRSTSFTNFFHMELKFCFPYVISRFPIRIILVFCEQTSIPNAALFPSKSKRNFLKLSFPQEAQVGVRTHFVQWEPQKLQCLTKMLATCVVVEHVSKYLDIRTLEFAVILERLSFLLECKLMLRRLPVLHNLVVLQ